MIALKRWRSSEKGFHSSLGCDVEPLRTLTRVNTEVKQQPVCWPVTAPPATPPLTLHTLCHTPLNAAYFIPHCCSFKAPFCTGSRRANRRTHVRAHAWNAELIYSMCVDFIAGQPLS